MNRCRGFCRPLPNHSATPPNKRPGGTPGRLVVYVMWSRAPPTCLGLSEPAGNEISDSVTMRDGGAHRLDRTLLEPERGPFRRPMVARIPPVRRQAKRDGFGDRRPLRPAVCQDHASGSTRMLRRIDHDQGGPNRRAIRHIRVLGGAGQGPCLMSCRSISRSPGLQSRGPSSASARTHPEHIPGGDIGL